ncbi:DUF1697 domain-containing protein [Carboxylicivirga linearis]|uniref:DUF1697 domain-containing protein n=1 Tax=Carboxylicivirga linearis TaxID=1628157 RepID=A0ABS5JUA2_9BACT|nr:DUF1697 domain-containing protein [Carboxylicivirga linearis]MBS2098460.1 DUF1697 domain-containing protein [Carboxylicivirga linearis]
METKIALLRGINVGGKRKILMADLKAMFLKIGFQKVETYIQSGNIIFQSAFNNSDIEKMLEKEISTEFGYEVPVIVRSAIDIKNLVKNNPYYSSEEGINNLHLTFLKVDPNPELVDAISSLSFKPDLFTIEKKEIYIFCDGKYHQSKLTNDFFEKKLKVQTTTRNWKTVLKLLELAETLH